MGKSGHAQRLVTTSGAILMHVALALVVVMGFAAFVVDQGVFYLARRQGQNAADAGAHAGAVARLFDEPGAPILGGITDQSALHAIASNPVIGTAPTAVVSYGCPTFASVGRCVTVE